MDQKRVNRWAAFWFFLPSSIALAYFVYYLSTFTPEAAAVPTARAQDAPYRIVPASPDRVILSKGTPQTIGNIRLTYMGIQADAVVIDVTILDLDPDYAYRRSIPTQVAEQGFSIAQQWYRLTSAGSSRLKMTRTNG